jgi:hypothetical protein
MWIGAVDGSDAPMTTMSENSVNAERHQRHPSSDGGKFQMKLQSQTSTNSIALRYYTYPVPCPHLLYPLPPSSSVSHLSHLLSFASRMQCTASQATLDVQTTKPSDR